MKRLFIFLTILLPSLCYSQWTNVYFQSDYKSALSVINQDTIVAIAFDGGRIHRSTNGGQNWVSYQTIFTQSWFLDVHFPTNAVGYACGGTAFGMHKEVIVKTTNGGQTWDSLTSNGFGRYNFTKIRFMNADTGFVAREGGDMLMTKDGGSNFTIIPTAGSITYMAIKPDQELVVALKKSVNPNVYAYSIAKSTDLGNSWNTVYSDTMSGVNGFDHKEINAIFFVNNNLGYAVGGNGLFMKTDDGGATWTSTAINPYSNLTGLHFINPDSGYINNAGGIYRTEDGGASWTVQKISPLSIIYEIQFANDTIGYALGDQSIYKTVNGGVLLSRNKISNKSDFTIYPNPTSHKLFITPSDEPVAALSVFNQLGQKIMETEATNELDVSELLKGVYVLVIETDQYQLTERFVKE